MVAKMKKVRGILLHHQYPWLLQKNPWVEPLGARSDVNVPRGGNIKLSTYIYHSSHHTEISQLGDNITDITLISFIVSHGGRFGIIMLQLTNKRRM